MRTRGRMGGAGVMRRVRTCYFIVIVPWISRWEEVWQTAIMQSGDIILKQRVLVTKPTDKIIQNKQQFTGATRRTKTLFHLI